MLTVKTVTAGNTCCTPSRVTRRQLIEFKRRYVDARDADRGALRLHPMTSSGRRVGPVEIKTLVNDWCGRRAVHRATPAAWRTAPTKTGLRPAVLPMQGKPGAPPREVELPSCVLLAVATSPHGRRGAPSGEGNSRTQRASGEVLRLRLTFRRTYVAETPRFRAPRRSLATSTRHARGPQPGAGTCPVAPLETSPRPSRRSRSEASPAPRPPHRRTNPVPRASRSRPRRARSCWNSTWRPPPRRWRTFSPTSVTGSMKAPSFTG